MHSAPVEMNHGKVYRKDLYIEGQREPAVMHSAPNVC